MGEYEAHSKRMRELICQAMIWLLEEKSFIKITVRDIMERAQIQRATFYRYFRDKYEVAESVNLSLAGFLAGAFFDGFYRGGHSSEDAQYSFDARYRKVLYKMVNLQIENIDLRKNLADAFSMRYKHHFPDCSEYEAYLASQNFLSTVLWIAEHNAPVSEIHTILTSDSQLRWLARYYRVSPEALSGFIEANKSHT